MVKCVVWDLDGTLWNGVLAEGDRPELRPGIRATLEGLDARGILNSIASANIHDDAWECLRSLGIEHLFVAPEINLGGKAASLQRIADRLSLRLEDMVFVDDDEFERDAVLYRLPLVTVIDAALCAELLSDPRFAPPTMSRYSGVRRQMVQQDLRRQADLDSSASPEEFLLQCSLRFAGRRATASDAMRISELATRTNQMNAAGRALSSDEVERLIIDAERYLLVAELSDRYGDYGLVAAALLRHSSGTVGCDGLWLSCRASRRGLPAAFFTYLGEHALRGGADWLEVAYKKSAHNRLAAIYLATYGFARAERHGEDAVYRLAIPKGIRPYEPWMDTQCAQ